MRRRLRIALLAAGALLLLALAGTLVVWPSSGENTCPDAGTLVVVRARRHQLWLCRAGEAEGPFRVALGRGGLDKWREGDGRTPLGEYRLGTPRPSARFHRFLPLDYPTPAQRDEGRTGSAIGIHGPDARFRFLGGATAWVDWTAGCLAVGTRGEIEQIEEWVVDARAEIIRIE